MDYVGTFQPEPRFERLLTVLRREGEPDRIPFLELFADPEIIEAVLGKPVPRLAAPEPVPLDKEDLAHYCDRLIEFSYVLGYDYVVSLVTGGASYQFGFLDMRIPQRSPGASGVGPVNPAGSSPVGRTLRGIPGRPMSRRAIG